MEITKEHPIRSARKRHGMTQQQLAAAAGVHKSVISRIETRSQGFGLETYRKLGAALGIDWRWLVEDQEQTT